MKKFTLLLALSCLIGSSSFAQSKIMESLKANDKVAQDFYLYPSTLRMLNIPDSDAYNKLIREIRKLSFYRLRPDAFDATAFTNTVEALKSDEQYEEYMVVDSKEEQLYILGKGVGDRMVIIGKTDQEYFAAESDGFINLLAIVQLYRDFNNEEGQTKAFFSKLSTVMGMQNGQ